MSSASMVVNPQLAKWAAMAILEAGVVFNLSGGPSIMHKFQWLIIPD